MTAVSSEVRAIGEGTEATSTSADELTRAANELSRLAVDLRTEVTAFLQQIG